jgi:hypothetical protein
MKGRLLRYCIRRSVSDWWYSIGLSSVVVDTPVGCDEQLSESGTSPLGSQKEKWDEADQANGEFEPFAIGSAGRITHQDIRGRGRWKSLHRQMRGRLPCEERCLPADTVQARAQDL